MIVQVLSPIDADQLQDLPTQYDVVNIGACERSDVPRAYLVMSRDNAPILVTARGVNALRDFTGLFAWSNDPRFAQRVEELSGVPGGFPVAIHDKIGG